MKQICVLSCAPPLSAQGPAASPTCQNLVTGRQRSRCRAALRASERLPTRPGNPARPPAMNRPPRVSCGPPWGP